MGRSAPVRSVIITSLFSLLWLLSGCHVLTSSQVKAVQEFSDATKNYGQLPGAVVDQFAAIRVEGAALNVPAAYPNQAAIDEAWNSLKDSRVLQQQMKDQGKRADNALKVLDKYSELLSVLSSDQFTDKLSASAEKLGDAVDGAIDLYNKQYGKNYDAIGSTVAAVVRGGGGIYIRYRQEQALRRVVPKADNIIADMTTDVEKLMALFVEKSTTANGTVVQPVFDAELGRIQDGFGALASASKTAPVSSDVVLRVATDVDRVLSAKELAAKCAAAAKAYREAHTKLKAAIEASGPAVTIEEIQTLQNEVEAAKALKKKIDDKKSSK